MHRLLPFLLAVSLLTYGADKADKKAPKQKEVKVQKSSVSMAQEIQLGKEAAAEVERQMEVVKNADIEAWLNRIGAQLAKAPQANAYPYYLRLVNEDSINAFALPGGPMFVHAGLIKAADNEGQVAGVLAHEMSHVALRHGVSQMGRSQTWQTILGLAGAAADMTGKSGGLVGTAINTGGTLGVGGILSKYSRDAERDADLNGARMLAAAGYNPLEMARFFEKLEAAMGAGARSKGLETWFASHPSPGRRVEAVSDDIRFYPAKEYGADTGQFDKIKGLVASIPPPKMKPAAALQPIQAQPRQGLPQGFKDLRTKDFAIAYPEGWQAGQAQAGGSLFLVPQGGAAKSQQGGIELIAGAMIDYYSPAGGSQELEAVTKALLQSLQQADPNMKVENSEPASVGGKPGKLTRLTTRTSHTQDPEQMVQLYSVARPAGLWTLALAFPKSRFAEAEPIWRQIVQTVAFAD
jgi:Zn-dependent protease with chaperone function